MCTRGCVQYGGIVFHAYMVCVYALTIRVSGMLNINIRRELQEVYDVYKWR